MQISARRFTYSVFCPRSRKEFKVSNVAFHSIEQWCASFSSSGISSDSFTPQKGRKKVTKQERSAMAADFVEKYRALNDGKFPSAQHIKDHIGGSYYTIRYIVQELKNNYKQASSEFRKEVKVGNENARSEVFTTSSSEVKKVHSSFKSKIGIKSSRLNAEALSNNQVEITSHKQFTPSSSSRGLDNGYLSLHLSSTLVKSTLEPQVISSGTSDIEEMNVKKQVPAELGTETVILCTSTDKTEVSKHDATFRGRGKEMSNQDVFRSEELSHDQPPRAEQDAASTKASSFWGYLKSITADIIYRWK